MKPVKCISYICGASEKKENIKQEKREFGGRGKVGFFFLMIYLIFEDNIHKESIKQEKEHLG